MNKLDEFTYVYDSEYQRGQRKINPTLWNNNGRLYAVPDGSFTVQAVSQVGPSICINYGDRLFDTLNDAILATQFDLDQKRWANEQVSAICISSNCKSLGFDPVNVRVIGPDGKVICNGKIGIVKPSTLKEKIEKSNPKFLHQIVGIAFAFLLILLAGAFLGACVAMLWKVIVWGFGIE